MYVIYFVYFAATETLCHFFLSFFLRCLLLHIFLHLLQRHSLYYVSYLIWFLIFTMTAMEDAHATVLNLDGSESEKNAFFAVYDGHGGRFSRMLTSNV